MSTCKTAAQPLSALDRWCKKPWLIVSLCISAALLIAMLVNWGTWQPSLKLLCAVATLVPIHATEEWLFPGGFAFQYNTFMYGSQEPSHSPMNRASDMFTVLLTTLILGTLTIVFACTAGCAPAGVVMGAAGFALLEATVHTYFGIRAYLKYRAQGKTTIYGPGSMTAYFGFAVLFVLAVLTLAEMTITGADIAMCLAVIAAIGCFAFVPERIFKGTAAQYAFSSHRYYERYEG